MRVRATAFCWRGFAELHLAESLIGRRGTFGLGQKQQTGRADTNWRLLRRTRAYHSNSESAANTNAGTDEWLGIEAWKNVVRHLRQFEPTTYLHSKGKTMKYAALTLCCC